LTIEELFLDCYQPPDLSKWAWNFLTFSPSLWTHPVDFWIYPSTQFCPSTQFWA